MQSFNIGLTGLNAARRAFDIIGNNIANAATEGYHRQRLELVPAKPIFDGKLSWGTGVDILTITRQINQFIEKQLLVQKGISGHTEQELAILKSIESVFGEFTGSSGLNDAISAWFNTMKDLVAHPTELIYQRQFVTAAQALSNYFQHIGTAISNMRDQVATFITDTVQSINTLTGSIAELNKKIHEMEISGAIAHNLRDQRDKLISNLAELVGIETTARDHGVVDVAIGNIPVVMGANVVQIESGYSSVQSIGICAKGSNVYRPLDGGRLGGLLSAHNELILGVAQRLDNLAYAIISNVNKYHVQGVGTSGSFTSLTGWVLNGELTLQQLGLGITNGTIYIRILDTQSGQVGRVQVEVDPANDTIQTIATKIAAIQGLDASVLSGKLHIEAEAGFMFDFLPAPLPEPDYANLAVPETAPDISLDGVYNQNTNDVLTFTIQGNGTIGNGDWSIIVTNQAGQTVSILNLGSGYVAGTPLDLGNGIKISFGVGSMTNGDVFTVQALAQSDTSGFLAAAGINAFFSGTSAMTMGICSQFEQTPGLVATCLGTEYTDNLNALRMSYLQDRTLEELGWQTISDYYAGLVASIGQDIAIKTTRQDNTSVMLQNLMTEWNQISGVDINEQAAQLLIYQQMYNALAKFMTIIQRANDSLLDIV